MEIEWLVRLALAEAELARERKRARVKGGAVAVVKWSDLEREFARHALKSLAGGGDRSR